MKSAEGSLEIFERQLFIENIQRGKLLAKVIIVFELIMILINLGSKFFTDRSLVTFDFYLMMYVFYIILCLAMSLVIYKFEKGDVEDTKRYTQYRFAFLTIICFCLIWGVGISLQDQQTYGNLIVFLVNTISMSVLIHASSRTVLQLYAFPVILLVVGLPFFQSSSAILVGHYINLPVFLFFCWLTSWMLYQRNYRNYCNELLLKEMNTNLALKIKENEKINQELENVNKRLEQLTLIDELTKIPNRRGFQRCIQDALTQQTEAKKLSLMMIDIDSFKPFNDNYGHLEGDKVIKLVAQKIQSCVRFPDSIAARFGGEEFVIAIFDLDNSKVFQLAEDIRKTVHELNIPHEYSTVCNMITVSIGIDSGDVDNQSDVDKLMENADNALYKSKELGRNRVEYFEERPEYSGNPLESYNLIR